MMTTPELRAIFRRLLSSVQHCGRRSVVACFLLVSSGSLLHGANEPIDWVNAYIGSGSGPVGYGGMMPFVVSPFGMTSWTPQTRQNKLGVVSYKYEDPAITGFMGTHQPAIWMGDYGYVTLMPEIDTVKLTPQERQLPYSHSDEEVGPDYYSVKMDAGESRSIRTEMTASEHCAYLRFTFPANSSSSIVVEASRPGTAGQAVVDEARHEITGYNPERVDNNLGPIALPKFKGYFVVEFDKPFKSAKAYADAAGPSGAVATFQTSDGDRVEARVGTSFISLEQARRNLQAEIPSWHFDSTRQALRKSWNDKLGEVSIDGATEDQRRIFYTAIYHALLYPRSMTEEGRYYSGFDDKVHTGESYTDYSIWDIFRCEWSFLTLIAPERIGGMTQALLQDYQEGGWMPKWPNPSYTNIMIATHADSLVAEATAKHFKGFDPRLAYAAVYKDAMTPPDDDTKLRWHDREPHTPYEGRGGLTYLKQLGYIPVDKTDEAASRTLEDAYDDWCVAQMAKSLGKTSDYNFFLNRSQNYKHLFNSKIGLMQGRNSDGSWAALDQGWTEGDTWVYSWAVMHDIPGLMQLMGGRDRYNAKLDEYFAGGHNQHGNEPSHHYGYLYDYSGQPWKTQAKVRQIAAKEYANHPSGLDGDDDCGQMSSWYIFTALGFYPVNPASGDYMIGSPLFTKATLQLAGGKQFTVLAENNSATNVYIQSATLNGKPLNQPVLRYDDIVAGATLKLTMGPQPSQWAADWHPDPLFP